MKPKSVITVSRKWNNPEIKICVTNEEINLEMSIEDFKEALIQEIGSVSLVFTEKQLRERVTKSINNVIQGIKEESIKVVS